MIRQRALSAAILCGLLACSAHADDMYKMVDKNGRVHYSDKPQPGWNKVNVTPIPVAPNTDPAALEEEAKREEACAKKREDLKRYEAAVIIKEKDALGNVHEYTPAERQQLIDATRTEADGLCTPPTQAAG